MFRGLKSGIAESVSTKTFPFIVSNDVFQFWWDDKNEG